mmetsp:Transcript_28671/g.35214  ORF Transcript_28671/g.35214 Transcript_28671/m.35214 type:complete len:115 (+) Transcript_28671:439-783(+)
MRTIVTSIKDSKLTDGDNRYSYPRREVSKRKRKNVRLGCEGGAESNSFINVGNLKIFTHERDSIGNFIFLKRYTAFGNGTIPAVMLLCVKQSCMKQKNHDKRLSFLIFNAQISP